MQETDDTPEQSALGIAASEAALLLLLECIEGIWDKLGPRLRINYPQRFLNLATGGDADFVGRRTMASEFDLVVRNGNVVDGTGAAPFKADVAVRDGFIVKVGSVPGRGRTEINAAGQIVTPGFVDIHTHYDGHATWTNRLQPSSNHGVTTVVMGNCGVGFAPCRKEDHTGLIKLMEGVEDIPGVVLDEGLPWDWETFPEYLERLEKTSFDMDVATQIPHAALRVYVMGQRGMDREKATAEDIAKMRSLAKEAVELGALGFSTSRSINHQTSDGDPIFSFMAAAEELTGIADGLKEADKGVLQIISDFADEDSEFSIIEKMSKSSGRPLTFSMFQFSHAPNRWKRIFEKMDAANASGAKISAQVCGRPAGILLGLDLSFNPFFFSPSYQEIADLPRRRRVEAMRDPERRARIISEFPAKSHEVIAQQLVKLDEMFILVEPLDYEPSLDSSLAALARAQGLDPVEYTYDRLLDNDGLGVIYVPAANFHEGKIDAALAMMQHEGTVLGLGDGGAHCGLVCDASFPTYMLTRWARGNAGPHAGIFPIQEVVKMLAAETASAVGLHDRGLIVPGYRADLNVIDFDHLQLHAPKMVCDLPSGRGRLGQKVDGYTATIVHGEVTYRGGIATGALPGRLVRGAQSPKPEAVAA